MVFLMLVEYLIAALALYGLWSEIVDPYLKQKPYFPLIRKIIGEEPVEREVQETMSDIERDYQQRRRIRDLEAENEQLRKERGETKL